MKKLVIMLVVLILPSIGYLMLIRGKNSFLPLNFYTNEGISTTSQLEGVKIDNLGLIKDVLSGDSINPFIKVQDRLGLIIPVTLNKDTSRFQILSNIYFVQHAFPALWQMKFYCFLRDTSLTSKAIEKMNKNFLIEGKRTFWFNSSFISDSSYLKLIGWKSSLDTMLNKTLLVDYKGKVRGTFDIRNLRDVTRLKDEIKVLVLEYKKR